MYWNIELFLDILGIKSSYIDKVHLIRYMKLSGDPFYVTFLLSNEPLNES